MNTKIFKSDTKLLRYVSTKNFISVPGMTKVDMHHFKNKEGNEMLFDTWHN